VLQVVATTTVAAYLGLGGLGRLLLDGLRSGPGGYPQMVAGALLTAGLAVLLDLLLAGVQRLVVPTGVQLSMAGAGPMTAAGRSSTEGAPAPGPESEDR
jgi:osmoprotectant transport system permease protein